MPSRRWWPGVQATVLPLSNCARARAGFIFLQNFVANDITTQIAIYLTFVFIAESRPQSTNIKHLRFCVVSVCIYNFTSSTLYRGIVPKTKQSWDCITSCHPVLYIIFRWKWKTGHAQLKYLKCIQLWYGWNNLFQLNKISHRIFSTLCVRPSITDADTEFSKFIQC